MIVWFDYAGVLFCVIDGDLFNSVVFILRH